MQQFQIQAEEIYQHSFSPADEPLIQIEEQYRVYLC